MLIKLVRKKGGSQVLNAISTSEHRSEHSFYCLSLLLQPHLIACLPFSPPQTLHHHHHPSALSASQSKFLPPPGSERVFGRRIPRGPIRAASDSAGTGSACLGNIQEIRKEKSKGDKTPLTSEAFLFSYFTKSQSSLNSRDSESDASFLPFFMAFFP